MWKEEREADILTNMNQSPAEGNFCNEMNNALKPSIVKCQWVMSSKVIKWPIATPCFNVQMDNKISFSTFHRNEKMPRSMYKWTTKFLFLLFTEMRKCPVHPSHRLTGESNNESTFSGVRSTTTYRCRGSQAGLGTMFW
jgi:hypothetical protein